MLTHNARHNVTSQNHIACLKLFMRSGDEGGHDITCIYRSVNDDDDGT